ncbi:unnamed protein product [Umbelopsis ramanniana]
MDAASVAKVAAAGVLSSMYLDSKLLISRDWNQIRAAILMQAHHYMRKFKGRLNYTYRFKEKLAAHPDKIFVIFENESWTFRDMDRASSRIARWFQSKGIKKGDVVCMMHQNHPSLFVAQFGLMKIGAIPALINNQLTDAALIHCVKVAKSSFFLVDPVYAGAVQPCVKELSDLGIEIWGFGEHEPSMPFAETLTRDALSRFSDAEISEEYIENAEYGEPAMLIYTSGTTGLPKPAIVEHTRMNFAGISYMNIHGVHGTDRVYCCLPLYHSSGQIVATAVAITSGATLVLGRKFSVTKFWEECIRYDVTVMVYIGEICRYLLSQPFNPAENKHRVRMAYGNGMRPDVWNRFRDRFGVGKISEFYGATEGPSSLFNPNTNEFGSGAVGFRGFLTRTLTGELKIIKIDPISEDPVRDKHGYCVECGSDEPGELLVLIKKGGPLEFKGYYKNEQATNKKILTHVFAKGDAYFRTGDLLKLTKDGFFIFGDRVGDTFRWKGENVSTAEVAQVLGVYPGIAEANVYGTEVPHHDGRAGMAAIVMQDGAKMDFRDFYNFAKQRLPKYAIPLFLRFVPAMEMTGTFKQRKVEYRNQGIDLAKVNPGEPIYWLVGDTYIPYEKEASDQITTGKAKL